MDVSKRVQFFLVWILVGVLSSWIFIYLVETVDRLGATVGLFEKVYEVSPVLAVASLFVMWGIVILWLDWGSQRNRS